MSTDNKQAENKPNKKTEFVTNVNIAVPVYNNNIEIALKILKRKYKEYGIGDQCFKNKEYTKKSVILRKQRLDAIYKQTFHNDDYQFEG